MTTRYIRHHPDREENRRAALVSTTVGVGLGVGVGIVVYYFARLGSVGQSQGIPPSFDHIHGPTHGSRSYPNRFGESAL